MDLLYGDINFVWWSRIKPTTPRYTCTCSSMNFLPLFISSSPYSCSKVINIPCMFPNRDFILIWFFNCNLYFPLWRHNKLSDSWLFILVIILFAFINISKVCEFRKSGSSLFCFLFFWNQMLKKIDLKNSLLFIVVYVLGHPLLLVNTFYGTE